MPTTRKRKERTSAGARCSPALVLAALLALCSPASPCTLRDTGHSGPFWTGRGWAFAVPRQSGQLWLVEYDPRGALLDERPFPVEIVDGWPTVQAVEGDGSLWLYVGCGTDASGEEPLCNQLARVDADGSVVGTWRPSDENWSRIGAESASFVLGQVSETSLRLRAIESAATGALRPPRDLALPAGVGTMHRGSSLQRTPRNPPRWAVGPDDSVALVQSDGDKVRVVVLDADGEIRYDRSYPLASPDRLREADDREFRLGMPILTELTSDGSLVLTAWRLHPDCSRDREPGFVVLGPEGRVRADVATEHHPTGLASAPGGEVAVLAHTQALVFDLDGRELARFETRPATWLEEELSLAERAQTVGPSDEPAEWVAVYSAATDDVRPQLDAWLVAAWPRSEAYLPDSLWQRLGDKLCGTHPEGAPAAALRRFETSRGRAKAAWLGVLVDCFRDPPTGGLEYATTLAESGEGRYGRHRQVVERAFEAWGTPFERLQATVEDMLARPFAVLVYGVPAALERTAPLLEEALRSEIPERRAAARGILLGWLGEPVESFTPEQRPRVEASRRLLVSRGERWIGDAAPFVANTGRLVLLATGARPASGLLPDLLAEVKRDANLAIHLPSALAYGPSDKELASLDSTLLVAMLAFVNDDVPHVGSRGMSRSAPGPSEAHLIVRLGDRGRELLWRRAMATGASDEARARLLGTMTSDPVAWGEARLLDVLDAAWLQRQAPTELPLIRLHQAAIGFLRAVVATAEDHQTSESATVGSVNATDQGTSRASLGEIAAQRFREMFLGVAATLPVERRSERLWGLFSLASRPPSLLSALEPGDAAQLVDESRAFLSAWLWLVAETGGWPAIENELAELLADSRHALGAARALAPHRHPAALDVLVERGLTLTRTPPVEAFVPYGAAARERVVPFLDHRDPSVRAAVTRVLRALEPPPELVDRFAREAAAAFERGELPDVETVLLLDAAGRDIFPALLDGSANPGPYGLQSQLVRAGYHHSAGFSRRFGRWALGSPDPELRARALAFLRELDDFSDPVSVAWSRHLAASLESAPSP